MALNRRTFFKALGVTGVTLAVGKQSASGNSAKNNTEFFGVLYDSTRCVGCQTCEVSCAEANGLNPPTDTPEAGKVRKTTDKYRTVVNAYQTDNGEVYVKTQCMHCNEPACAAACLTQAMYKTHEGAVIWRGKKCMGCRYCMVSCPFDAPKFEYFSSNPKIEKCTMCYERTQEGKLPACVENCPAEAMMYGPRRELIKEARKRIVENPGIYVDHIYGEHEAGGTGWLYLSGVPFEKAGFNTGIQTKSYPELSKGFLYSVPTIFILWPAILLGIREGSRNNNENEESNE
jgi:Fe-S-cluster-containing dehydrogenase component